MANDDSNPDPGTADGGSVTAADDVTVDDGVTAGDGVTTGDGVTADGGVTVDDRSSSSLSLRAVAGAALPVLLLAVLVGAFLVFPPFGTVSSGEPLPDVSVTHATLPNDHTVVLHVTNSGASEVTIEQVLVDEAYWGFSVRQGGGTVEPPYTLSPAESAQVVVPYHWQPTWDLHADLVLSDGSTWGHTIVAPQATPGMTTDVLWTLAVVGFFVGIVPVLLGMLWFPFMQDLSDRWLHAILAFSIGILTFLAFDAGFEAFEVAESIPNVFEGALLVVVGIISAALLVQAVSSWGSRGEGETSPLTLAYLVALGVGLHNLAEGLAIGGAFALGRVALGTFLILGFMIHNVTEGPAVVAPVARGERPALWHFPLLGLLAGAPIIVGGWLGGFARGPTIGAFALALGVGAILQVDWEIASMIRRQGRLGTAANLVAFLVGLVVMYATDLLVAV